MATYLIYQIMGIDSMNSDSIIEKIAPSPAKIIVQYRYKALEYLYNNNKFVKTIQDNVDRLYEIL
jgi:hypothetical protein